MISEAVNNFSPRDYTKYKGVGMGETITFLTFSHMIKMQKSSLPVGKKHFNQMLFFFFLNILTLYSPLVHLFFSLFTFWFFSGGFGTHLKSKQSGGEGSLFFAS